MFNTVRKEFTYGSEKVILESGNVARQATGAVMITVGGNTLLVTVVGKREADAGRSFFPLTVNYQEKTYAAGKIPGGFFKREGRPTEKETLTCRLIDRPIRPLFPNGFMNEVQVIATVVATDKKSDPDIAALIGTSAALAISGIPFNGPIAAARVGYKDGMYLLNPDYETSADSDLDLVVAGTQAAVLMVESEAKELSEDQMLGAVLFGHMELQKAITAINEFADEVGTEKWDWSAPAVDTSLKEKVSASHADKIAKAYKITDKMDRYGKLGELKDEAINSLCNGEEGAPSRDEVKGVFASVEKGIVRENVLSGSPRIDGRALDTVRAIDIEVGFLPFVHGSAKFTRGETQAIVVATLGGQRDGQRIESLQGPKEDKFMLHYNFPPFCVGEAGFMSGPKRREIGHGRLARRGIETMLPGEEEFPYTMRVVSEITESNGSSSMASICGSSLAMMDAGVPLKAPVAGIAMGLVKEGNRFAVLSDILGDEDHLGDMDFKVAGSEKGVTALQMDIKIEGINEEIMEKALIQAKAGRLHILDEMNKVLAAPREKISPNAPTYLTVKINPDKIRDVIGKGGATIRSICDETGSTVDIDDSGLVKIYGDTGESANAAKAMVEGICEEPEVGRVYKGTVKKIVDFGAFVEIIPGTEGLLHISQIANERVEDVSKHLSEGDVIDVKCLDFDNRGRIKLSIKALLAPEENTEAG